MLLKTKYDLDNAREQYGKLVDKQARKVLVCAGTGCVAGGSLNIYQKLIETISAKGLECVVALADECGITVMRSTLRAYEACGLLYTAGLGNDPSRKEAAHV